MKKIEAIIKPFKLEEVKDALEKIGVTGLTVTEVRGFGKQKEHKELFQGREYILELLPKIKIEIAVSDDKMDEVINIIMESARTGNIGDGKILVSSLDEVYRIRTGDKGNSAL